MSAVRLTSELADIFEFWTPSEIKNYVATVGAGYTTLADDIGRNPNVFDAAEMAAWSKALSNFLDFYKGMGFFSSLSMSAVRTAETYAGQLAYFREVFQRKSGKAPTGAAVSIPSQSQDKTLDTVRLIAIVAGIGAAGYLAAQILRAGKAFR